MGKNPGEKDVDKYKMTIFQRILADYHLWQIGSGISLPRFVIEKYSSDYCNVNTSTGFTIALKTLATV